MMRLAIMTAMVVVLASALGGVQPALAEDAPTYNQHVGAILLENCASCHRPNQVAPMALLSYKDTRPWARAIKRKGTSGICSWGHCLQWNFLTPLSGSTLNSFI